MSAGTRWQQELAEFFGVDDATAAELVALIADVSCWLGSRVDGVSMLRVPLRDPRVRAVVARGYPGSTLPARPSDQLERVLVLQGSLCDEKTGRTFSAGAQIHRPPGEHSPLTLAGEEECLFCVWVGPVEVPGES